MALEFAHGAIQWSESDALNTIFTVSGLSFQPKALRFYWVGLGSTIDASSETVNSVRGVGFGVSPSSRRCVSSVSVDAAGNAACATRANDNGVVSIIASDASEDGRLDLNSITSDGFTLIVDDVLFLATESDITIFWEAWGGSDITVAAVGDIAEPAATGNVDYTVTGFVAGATDQVVMFAGVQSVAALNTGDANDSGMHVGFSTATDATFVCGNSDDGSATMDTDGMSTGGFSWNMITIGGGAPNASNILSQFGTNNFRLNWITRATTNRRSIFLAIKGGNWKVGNYIINGNTGGATTTVSGLSFAPIGLCLLGRMSSSGSGETNDRIGLGTGSSTSSRRSMGVLDEDGIADAEIDTTIQYDQVLSFPSTTGTLQSAYDIDAMNADGFRIIVDTAGGVANEIQGYLTFGNVAAGGAQAPLLMHGQQYMRTSR